MRAEQELQELRRRERGAGAAAGTASSAASLGMATGTGSVSTENASAGGVNKAGNGVAGAADVVGPGGSTMMCHADAVEAELAELTRVNSQLRGDIVAKEMGWREERQAHEAAGSAAKVGERRGSGTLVFRKCVVL